MRIEGSFRRAAVLAAVFLLFAPGAAFSAKKKNAKSFPPEKVVIGTVGKHKITLAEYNRFFERIPENLKDYARARKDQMIQNIAYRYLMLQYARKNKIYKKKAVIRKIEDARREVLIRESVRLVEESAKPTEEELKAEYENNKLRYTEGGKVTASHIMVDSPEKAKKILAELKKGADFAELAKKHSIAPEQSKGGTLGTFERGHHKLTGLPEIVEKTAFSLKAGTYSGVVRSVYGWHVVYTHKRLDGKQLNYAEVRDRIREQLGERKRKAAMTRTLADLQKDYPVIIYPERVP